MDRRTSMKWVLAAFAATRVRELQAGPAPGVPVARGYGTDPRLSDDYHPGDLWPLTLSEAQRRLAGSLADIIIPADEHSAAATAAGVVDFIDEWVSAPYPACLRDRGIVLAGLAWLDEESGRRFGRDFIGLAPARQTAVCDDICDPARASAALQEAARFFARFRDLAAAGFYSSPIGREDLRYIGNTPLASFDGPSIALLKSLGLA
jgi:hypothetical protein